MDVITLIEQSAAELQTGLTAADDRDAALG
jgi:hypothetical protein